MYSEGLGSEEVYFIKLRAAEGKSGGEKGDRVTVRACRFC